MVVNITATLKVNKNLRSDRKVRSTIHKLINEFGEEAADLLVATLTSALISNRLGFPDMVRTLALFESIHHEKIKPKEYIIFGKSYGKILDVGAKPYKIPATPENAPDLLAWATEKFNLDPHSAYYVLRNIIMKRGLQARGWIHHGITMFYADLLILQDKYMKRIKRQFRDKLYEKL
ncbi:MAG: hypothetical protein ACTSQY_00995 [Candidatus Odinarchaeia archaeon]